MNIEDMKIGIIGHFGGDKTFSDGQTVKTKEVEKAINKNLNSNVKRFDTYKNSRNIIKLICGICKMLKENDIVIFLLSTRGYSIILPIISIINKKYKRKIYDFVIGSRYEIYKRNIFIRKLAKKIDGIYVETENLRSKYNKIGIYNVNIMPNFKELDIYSKIPDYIHKDKIRLCTFTRICKEKGIEDAINAVEYANNKLKKNIFYLDIYGPIEEDYINEFNNLRNNISDFIYYQGIADPNNSSNIIKDYDIMLFLTYWKGEAFPGTIIDAFSAGVPVIATDWNCNFEILKENYTGFKVPIKSPKVVGELLIDCYNNQKRLNAMKSNSIKEAYRYIPSKIIKNFLNNVKDCI